MQKQLAGQLTRAEREVAEAVKEAEEARAAKTALETALQTAHRWGGGQGRVSDEASLLY